MPQQVLDPMDNAAPWSALEPDDATPSTELSLAPDALHFRFGADRRSGRITATTAALDHRLRRSLPNVDLAAFDELRFWLRSDRVADGTAARPFFLELRLASAAMGLDDAANTWHRFLPVTRAESWELVRLSLADLSAAVRGAVNRLQLRCVDASAAFTCYIDDLTAVREAMVADVDAALLERLHERLTINGTQVPAVFHLPELVPAQARPFIRLMHYDVRFAEERTGSVENRGDYSGPGYRLRPPALAYDLYYELDIPTDTRAHQAQILEFVLATLAPRGDLIVNSIPLPLERVEGGAVSAEGERLTDRAAMRYRVATRQEVAPSVPVVPPFQEVVVEADTAAPVP